MAREMMVDGYFHSLRKGARGFLWTGLEGMPPVPTVEDAVRYALEHCGTAARWRLVFLEDHTDREWTEAIERAHAPRILREQVDACVCG